MTKNELIFYSAYFGLLFGVPLILCLSAMGRRIRADYEMGDPRRIASDVGLQRALTVKIVILVVAPFLLGHWFLGLLALLMGTAFLLPFWLNSPQNSADGPQAD